MFIMLLHLYSYHHYKQFISTLYYYVKIININIIPLSRFF